LYFAFSEGCTAMSHRQFPSRLRARVAAPAPAAAGHRPLLLAVALASGFSASAWAQPTGAQAIHGGATLSRQGANLVVTTQNGAGTRHSAINWQSFNIPGGSTTHFAQPDAASTSINRVLGGNPSAIFGTLSSNGRLVLVNPAGITVGAGAVVDTAGFTASTLRMSDADAIAGRLRFGDGSAAGPLRVDGRVLASSGDVVLIGSDVQAGAQAVIQSPQGATVLAAGQKVELTGRGLEGIRLEVQAPTDQAVNLGTLQGDAVGIFAGTLRHSGLIQASAATVQGGRVVLKAVEHAETSGTVVAQGAAGAGGQVDLLGRTVGVMAGAVIDSSNTAGGGRIRVGGDYLGGNPDVPNAQITYVAADAQLRANATESGDGGRVIVWADDTTRVHGSIQARGGANGGDGGFVETSGKRYLDANGARVDASATAGLAGQWLLDPSDLTISVAGTTTPGLTNPFTAGTGNSLLTLATLQSALNGGTGVTLRTDGTGTGGTGNIVFDATAGALDIVRTAGGSQTLTVDAYNDIVFTGGATMFRTQGGSGRDLSVVLQAGGGIHTETGAWVKLATDDNGSKVSAIVANGKTWTNDGNVTLNLNGKIDLSSGATFQNNGLLDGAAGPMGGVWGGNFINWSDVRLNQGHFNVGTFSGGGSFRFDGNAFSAGSFDFSGTDLKIRAGTGDVLLSGYGINASGPVSLEAVGGDVEVMSGITASTVGVAAGGDITVHGYVETYGGRTSLGGAGGGMVTLAAGGSVTVHGGIDSSGGYDYSGASVGGAGGDINVTAGNDITIGSIYAYGGSASGDGVGGNGAAIKLSYGGRLAIDYIDAAGGDGGYSGEGVGGTGGRGGSLTIIKERGDLELTGLHAYLDGGYGGDGRVGGQGGLGGALNLIARNGGVKLTETDLSVRGGGGGYSDGGAGDAGGTGGQGGAIRISATGASQIMAWLDASGGTGGAADYYAESHGGNGGNGGSIDLQVGGPLTLAGGLWAGGGDGGEVMAYEAAVLPSGPVSDPARTGANGALGSVYLAAAGGITVPADMPMPVPTPTPTLTVALAATVIPPISGDTEAFGSLQVDGALTNASSMKLASGATMLVSGPVTNNGAIDLGTDATLAIGYTYDPVADSYTFGSGTLTNTAGALLTGSGTVQGSVLNAGTVAPGEGGAGRIGQLSITGNYQQTATGRLEMDVAANSPYLPGLTYDQLNIGGGMTMDGQLIVNAVPAVTVAGATQLAAGTTSTTSTAPVSTQFYELLKAAAASGSFDLVAGPTDVLTNIRMNIGGTVMEIPGNRVGGLLAAIAAMLPGVALSDIQQVLVESMNNALPDRDEEDKASGESDIVVTDASCKPA
jgi:filamentous hemagglutinin family protein